MVNFHLTSLNPAAVHGISGTLDIFSGTPLNLAKKVYVDTPLATVIDCFKFRVDAIDVSDGAIADIDTADIEFANCGENWAVTKSYGLLGWMAAGAEAETESLGANINDAVMTLNVASGSNPMGHDYVRYLALKTFGNVETSDLFNNEIMLVQETHQQTDLVNGPGYPNGLQAKITLGGGSDPNAPATGNPAGGNTDRLNTNHAWELLTQCPASRLQNVAGSDVYQNVPLEIGDVLNFTLTMSSSVANATGLNGGVIPDVDYQIIMTLSA